jgi:hypothetical protein
MAINALGAVATGLTVLVVAAAKFAEGAWITLVLIPALLILMLGIRRHYRRVARETASATPLRFDALERPLVVVPIDSWSRVAKKALRFAIPLSDDILVLHIESSEETDSFQTKWSEWVEEPARKAGRPVPQLVVMQSPYRFVVGPIVDYLRDLALKHPDRQIAVVISELAERHWYNILLHNQRAEVLTALLMLNGDERIAVVNVPWCLKV